jgi:hypothetical protein
VEDLAQWFRDPQGVKDSTTVAWFNLPSIPPLTINNPMNYAPSGGSTERITMTGQGNWNAGYSVSFKESSTLLSTMALLWADLDKDFKYLDWPTAEVKGAECGLYLCVKEFDTKVVNGKVIETSKETPWTRDKGSYQVLGGPRDDPLVNQNLLDIDLGKTQRTNLQIVVPGKSLNGPFSITQAGVCGLIYYINKSLDDGTL